METEYWTLHICQVAINMIEIGLKTCPSGANKAVNLTYRIFLKDLFWMTYFFYKCIF